MVVHLEAFSSKDYYILTVVVVREDGNLEVPL